MCVSVCVCVCVCVSVCLGHGVVKEVIYPVNLFNICYANQRASLD